ncbi:MAG: family 65 glycosyl hydrolase domain-containing protein [Bacteroidetes bacterium]|nr:family 65 glycosyl hydrolase domain-containing protein [Bacteroidota bacterium]
MKDYIVHDGWKIIEDGFHPEHNKITESLMSLGNGRMGHRANFEEKYSGPTLPGNYVAGVYYPDKTRVGWWKNGYPEYFAKVLNAANWIGIDIRIGNTVLDLNQCKILDFRRELDMMNGLLSRTFTAELTDGKQINVTTQRFVSIAHSEIGAIRYTLEALNFSEKVVITPYIDFDVINEDANYDEKFWDEVNKSVSHGEGYVTAEVRKTFFQVCTGMKFKLMKNGEPFRFHADFEERQKFVSNIISLQMGKGSRLTIEKYGVNLSSEYCPKNKLNEIAAQHLNAAYKKGFDRLLQDHADLWHKKWETSDILIKGDVAAQQGIRFNIFQLQQTYTGEDERLNIGPKGFTGEKYGGSTYWDTEAYCIPFFLATAPRQVAQNLLSYRHKHLQKAIENGEKLGFKNGAALYPMVTMNGEECHNEWEITFEEVHRNGAIAFAIYDYIRYTGDTGYLLPKGFEVLLAISRFWSQRVNWSEDKQKYVMLGVTGPNEYENNVNNNFHTNRIAQWTLKYTLEVIDLLKKEHHKAFAQLKEKWNFDEEAETSRWRDIIEKIYFAYDPSRDIFLQQDGFLDKELIPAAELPANERPLNQNWSWDRILRSPYIKQADTLQSLYLFENEYDKATIQRHFDFYEPLTVHESSLSPCIHTILASAIGYPAKAYELYLRTSRLDLDDYNNDTEDGCHITSMGGTWIAFVQGFGGMRVKNGRLHFAPILPDKWEGYSFLINFRNTILKIEVNKQEVVFDNYSGNEMVISIYGKEFVLPSNGVCSLPLASANGIEMQSRTGFSQT